MHNTEHRKATLQAKYLCTYIIVGLQGQYHAELKTRNLWNTFKCCMYLDTPI